MLFDVFISHAWEDKDDFVRELAELLQNQRIEVWYDDFSLKVGDSLRRSIDLGLTKSRFGIVVLSKNFFHKDWTNWELDGLVQRQNSSEYNLIIPIWHKIDKKEILEYSPSLADKVAIKTSRGMDYVVKQIEGIINPKGSTLIIARDFLLSHGIDLPVITDDWWLDVIEYCGNKSLKQEYLRFNIPWNGLNPSDRGVYIGLNALQLLWQQKAKVNHITQLTHPKEVLNFLESQPGLKDACMKEPEIVALYFPQLVIKNFGGFLESSFDKRLIVKSGFKEEDCDELVAMRHLEFYGWGLSSLASFYFTGRGVRILCSTQQYDLIDCLVWLLSVKSSWLPKKIKNALLKGMIKNGVWNLYGEENISNFKCNYSTGALSRELFRSLNASFKMTKKIKHDIETRIKHSKDILNLPETVNDLFERFFEIKIIESWLEIRKDIRFKIKKGSD